MFVAADRERPVRMELLLSPDFRYLSRELLDTTIDPIEEAKQKERTLAAGLTNGNFPALGPRQAPVTLTVFSNFQCPYCAKLAAMLKNQVLPLERNNVRVVFRHFPLTSHEWAERAARAAACAQNQSNDSFWSLHDFVFDNQHVITLANIEKKLMEHTRSLRQFDQGKFQGCLADKSTSAVVDRDLEFAKQGGINGTPTVFVNGRQLSDIANAEQILTLVREQLRRARGR